MAADGPFRIADFRRRYGAAQFHFCIGKNLFIFLDNVFSTGGKEGYLDYLEKVLHNQAKGKRKIFVFMHIPPDGLNASILSRGLAGSARFMQLARDYGIDYVFSGDHHGYVKTVRDGTTYIVTGGGGARLRGDHGGFHHIVRMVVHDGSVEESVVAAPARLETWELLARNLAIYCWPFLIYNRWVTILLSVLCGLATVGLWRCRRYGRCSRLFHGRGSTKGGASWDGGRE